MKVLVVGLGSIGQRHLQNIISLQPKIEKIVDEKIELFSLRSNLTSRKVIRDGSVIKINNFDTYYNLKTLTSLSSAINISPDVVFITNPTSLHVKMAEVFASLGSHLFIEKPLDSKKTGVDNLIKIVKEKKLVTMVGYQTRFNPLIRELKRYLDKNSKKTVSASFAWHTYLPHHHKYEDYSKGYAAKRSLGGGVIMGLIHEIDLIYYFFGLPNRVSAFAGKLSELKMDVEDTAKILMKYTKNSREFIVDLSLSYAQMHEERGFTLRLDDSTVVTDLVNNKTIIYNKDGKVAKKMRTSIERNDLFKNEIIHFFKCIANNRNTGIDISDALESLKIALASKKSVKSLHWEKI